MRWDTLTGLEPETAEDRRRMTEQYTKFASGLGRSCVVWLLAWSVLFSTPEEMMVGNAPEALLIVVLGAHAWALYPMVDSLWGLFKLYRKARGTGP